MQAQPLLVLTGPARLPLSKPQFPHNQNQRLDEMKAKVPVSAPAVVSLACTPLRTGPRPQHSPVLTADLDLKPPGLSSS